MALFDIVKVIPFGEGTLRTHSLYFVGAIAVGWAGAVTAVLHLQKVNMCIF